MELSRNTKRRLVFYGSLLFAISAFAIYCSAMPGRSFRGPPPPLDAREARYEPLVRALARTIGERNTMRPRRLHEAADYIESQLRDAGYEVQRYPGIVSAQYPDRGDFVAFVGDMGSRSLVRDSIRTFRATAHIASEGAALPAVIPGVDWSDHRAFRSAGYPAIMVTDTATFRNPNYHKLSDAVETVDYAELARVVAGVEDVVGELARR